MIERIHVGDDVICTTDGSPYFTEGKRYRVWSVNAFGSVNVEDDDGELSPLFSFRKAEKKPHFITVWCSEDRTKFNLTGDVFTSLEDAEASAREVAGKDLGYCVAVFEVRSFHTASLEVKSEVV